MGNEEEVEAIFEFLLDAGALELTGMNAFGEPAYRITEKCEEIFPEFYKVHREALSHMAYDLWTRGLIDITFTNETEKISFGEANFKVLEDVYKELTAEEAEFLSALGAPLSVNLEFED